MAILSVDSVSYSYQGAAESRLEAVKGVSFSVERGEYVAVLGANGSGKSTLARLICGFLEPDSGTITGAAGFTRTAGQSAPTGIVFQDPKTQILASIVNRDAAFGPANLGFSAEETASRVEKMLAVTHLSEKHDSRTTELSLGQTQKLALAGILAMTPELLVLDEAVSMIDPGSREEILSYIDECHTSGQTVLSITHDMTEALRADRILVLQDGALIADESREAFVADRGLQERLFGAPSAVCATAGAAGCPDTGRKTTLSFDGVQFAYPGAGTLFDGLSVAFREGTLTAVMGASGSGKSTLFELAAGLLLPEAGSIRGVCRPALAMQECEGALFEVFTADDVAYGPRNAGLSGKALKERVRSAMEKAALPFEEFADRPVRQLSGGEKRRVSLAGIIALDTPVIIFDEPCAGLDPIGRRHIIETMRALSAEGKTVIFSTHHDDEAEGADRLIRMEAGRIVADSAPAGLQCVDQASSADAGTGAAQGLTELPPLDDGFLSRLKQTAGGAYSAVDSPVHRLPAWMKYLVLLGVFIPSIAIRSWQPAACMIPVALLYSLLAKVPLRRSLASIFRLIPWLLFFTAIQFLFFPVQSGDPILWQLGFIRISESKIDVAVMALIHVVAAIFCLQAFLSSTDETALVDGLKALVPVRAVVLTVLVIIRFIPLLAEEAALIIKVQLIRGGLKDTKGFFNRVRSLLPLFVPLINRTLDRAEDMADALTARYF